MSSNVQWRQIVNGDVIDRRPMVKQNASTVHVVALGCHVQRSQTILKNLQMQKLSKDIFIRVFTWTKSQNWQSKKVRRDIEDRRISVHP